MNRVASLCACAAVLMAASTASAGVTRKGATFSGIAANTRGSAVAYDSINHAYLVVETYGVLTGRVFAEDGTPLTNPFQIQASANFTHFPRVAFSPDANGGNGGFLVTWHESDLAGGATSVHCRIVSSSGGLLSGDTQLPPRLVGEPLDSSSWWEGGPPVAYATGGKLFLVTWTALTNGRDIRGIFVNNSGAAVTSVFNISASTDYEDNSSIGYNPSTDKFLVSYAGFSNAGNYAFVSSRLVTPGVTTPGGPTMLATAAGTYITDTVYSPASGNYQVAWYQGAGYGRQVDASGNVAGSITLLSSRYASNDALSIAFNPVSNTMLMVSHDLGGTVEDGAVELTAAGSPVDAGQLITAAGGSGNFYPRVAANARAKEWLMVAAHSFASTIGQFAQTDATGSGGGGPALPQPMAVNSIGISPSATVTAGTQVTVTANVSGGTTPYAYQFWINNLTAGTGWTVAQAYSASSTFSFTPAAGTYGVQVWVRNAGSPNAYDAYNTASFVVGSTQAQITSFTANQSFPLAPGIPITWTVASSPASGTVEYKWWEYSASGWTLAQDWSGISALTWSPAAGTHAVQVWARRVGSGATYEDYRSTTYFTIATTPAHVQSLTANTSFPSSPSTTLTFTAAASGGSGPLEYQFWLYRSASNSWTLLRDWSSSNQASWTPGVISTGQNVVQVWVRTQGSSAMYEDWMSTGYFLVSDSTDLTLSAGTSLTALRQGNSVTFTAQMVGGGGPYEYQFWTYDAGSGTWTGTAYTGSAQFTWSGISAGTHTLQVWSRAVGSTGPWERWKSTGMFVVNP